MKSFIIIISIVALIALASASVIFSENRQVKIQNYLYLSGEDIQYAESTSNTTNEGYLILHPGRSYLINSTIFILGPPSKQLNRQYSLSIEAPPWLDIQPLSEIFKNGTAIFLSITPQNSSPLGVVGSLVLSANDSNLLPATVYFTVVPLSEKIVPEKSLLLTSNSSGYFLSSSFQIAYNYSVTSITASIPDAGVHISTSEKSILTSNSTGLFIKAVIRSRGIMQYNMPLQPLPLVYTIYSQAGIPLSLITDKNYTMSMEFNFSDGSVYTYTQVIPVISIGSTQVGGVISGNYSNFTIIASNQGYNQSILHGAPSNPWPVIKVKKGAYVTITIINNDTIEPHGFAINHYFDRGVAIQPGQSYTISFTADQTGNFIIYCNIPCSIHVYMIAELQVSG